MAKDIALCRACGVTSPFSVVTGAAGISLDALANPPKYVEMEEGIQGEVIITYRRISRILWFLIPFTMLWSGGSMAGIYGTQIAKGQFDAKQSLAGLPFLIGTVILVSVIVSLLLVRWVITLNKGEGTVFVGRGSFGWTPPLHLQSRNARFHADDQRPGQ